MRRRSVVMPAVLLALATLVGACGGPQGIGSRTDDASFRACVEKAGVSLSGADDWSTAQQRRFLSRTDALTCAVDELSQTDLSDAMRAAFGDSARTTTMAALTGFATGSTRTEQRRAEDLGRLLAALDPDAGEDSGDNFGTGWRSSVVRTQLAWAVVREAGQGTKLYASWLEKHPDARRGGPTPDVEFFTYLEDARRGTPEVALSDAIGQIRSEIYRGIGAATRDS